MAASPVHSPRKPHEVALPDTPAVQTKSRKQKKGKGKGKEAPVNETHGNVNSSSKGNFASKELVSDEGDYAWAWATLADSSSSNRPAVFTSDGRYFFAIVGSSVRIYSVATGKVVSTLSPSSSGSSASRSSEGGGHTDLITAAIINPQNPFQLLTASLDGSVKVWDFLDAVLLQTIDVGTPISHMCAHERYKGHVFVAAITQSNPDQRNYTNRDKGNTLIFRVSLKPSIKTAQSRVSKSSEVLRIGKTRAANALAISPSGLWLVAIAGCKAYVAMTSSLDSGFTKFISPEKLTCLAFHPIDEYFATGDEKGQIRLWYCLNNQISFSDTGVEKRAQTTMLHWHAHAVSSISFTPNGAYLLSGGEECVLVIWQLHTGKKEFIPRVGAPITSITVRARGDVEEEYLLGLADSSFIFINAGSLKVTRSVSRIRLDPVVSRQRQSSSAYTPLGVHPLSSSLILPSSHPSSLQTYSPSASTLISELEVSPSNRVSRRDEKPIEPSRVERVAICPSGEWMATIDRREGDDDFSAEGYLKFWHWDGSTWSLNTRIDRPHGGKSVTTITFSSEIIVEYGWVLMTSGLDGHVKTWGTRTLASKKGNTENFWTSRSSFAFRSEMPADATWSPDASLLAVAFGPYVTLHDPGTNALLNTLTSCEVNAIKSVRFVGRSGRFLLVSGQWDTVLWDLVKQSIRWHFRSPHVIGHVVPHPQDDVVAIFLHPYSPEGVTERWTRVLIFYPPSSVVQETKTLPFRLRSLAWYPSGTARFSLAGITHTWSVVLVGDEVNLPDEEGSSPREISSSTFEKTRRTLFQDIFGQSAFTGVSSEHSTHVHTEPKTGQEALAILDAPAYLAPPIGTLYSSLMGGFMTKRPEERDVQEAEPIEEQDVGMDIEESSAIPSASRVIGDSEFDSFIELFKKYAVNTSAEAATNVQIGRSPVPNGIHQPMPNGVHPSSPRSSPHLNGTSHLSVKKVTTPLMKATLQLSSPLSAGKKRKQFMG